MSADAKTALTILMAAFLLMGALFFTIGFLFLLRVRRLKERCSEKTMATAVRGTSFSMPHLVFDANGQEMNLRLNLSVSTPNVHTPMPGQTMELYFDPYHPKTYFIPGYTDVGFKLIGFIFGGLGLLFMVLGVIFGII